ncbi:MAG: hypothetical protein ABW185_04640 [Sedimenticola sp.]
MFLLKYRYATQAIGAAMREGISRFSRMRVWRKVVPTEMMGFIAVILNMGLIRKASIEEYWSTRSSQTTKWFRKMFPRNRFQNILKYFHVVDSKKLPPRTSDHYR